jgi:hypothetical protein
MSFANGKDVRNLRWLVDEASIAQFKPAVRKGRFLYFYALHTHRSVCNLQLMLPVTV